MKNEYPAYSDKLYTVLKDCQAFDDVVMLEPDSQGVKYTAAVNKHVYGSAGIPFLFLISFGIIPEFAEENEGVSFVLMDVSAPNKPIYIDVIWRQYTIIGWYALIANLLPWRGWGDPVASTEFKQRLKWEIFQHLEKAK